MCLEESRAMTEDSDREPRGLEPGAHSFVLKVWREDHRTRPGWRGQITHVGSGARRSITRLAQIDRFIVGYLEQLVGPLSLAGRLRRLRARFWR